MTGEIKIRIVNDSYIPENLLICNDVDGDITEALLEIAVEKNITVKFIGNDDVENNKHVNKVQSRPVRIIENEFLANEQLVDNVVQENGRAGNIIDRFTTQVKSEVQKLLVFLKKTCPHKRIIPDVFAKYAEENSLFDKVEPEVLASILDSNGYLSPHGLKITKHLMAKWIYNFNYRNKIKNNLQTVEKSKPQNISFLKEISRAQKALLKRPISSKNDISNNENNSYMKEYRYTERKVMSLDNQTKNQVKEMIDYLKTTFGNRIANPKLFVKYVCNSQLYKKLGPKALAYILQKHGFVSPKFKKINGHLIASWVNLYK